MKSHRNSKKCRVTGLSAGDRERIATHCPPDMTETVKASLLKEIEEFNTGLARHEREVSASGGASVDAYHNWLDNHGDQEPPEANPDTVSDEDGIKYIPSKKDVEIARLLKEFRHALTRRELQVWNLVMQHQLSHAEAAKLLNTSDGNVYNVLKRARQKFEKFGEAMKHARQD